MEKVSAILVADRNPHVRNFLRRELRAEGYRVSLARNSEETLRMLEGPERPDLLILDPDLPDTVELDILKILQERIPDLPVIVHTFISEYMNPSSVLGCAAFVEKEGSNIDRLKQVIREALEDRRFRGSDRSRQSN